MEVNNTSGSTMETSVDLAFRLVLVSCAGSE